MREAAIALRAVRVRPIEAHEEARWKELMRQRHYLGFQKFCGAQLKQVAVVGERWLALLGWQAAALHCGPRERWIGWSPRQRRTRLFLVANQARFLVLEAAGTAPGLASRVLGLSLRRLERDWRERNGSALLLAESYVDPARFRGTCYRAANWIELGQTLGYGRVRGGAVGYQRHGQPKGVFVYPLRRGAREQLAAREPRPEWHGERQRIHLTDKQLESLWKHLRRVPEFRARKGLRHPLTVVLVIVLAARLAGKRNTKHSAQFGRRLTAKQLRRAGARPHPRTGVCRAPSLNTIRRVLQGVEAQRLEQELDAWLAEQGQQQEPGEALALDGKTLRGSYDHDLQEDGEVADKAAQQQLTVAGIDTRQVYAQQGLTGKKEDAEAQVARELLERLDSQGRCIVADALHTQRETAQTILDRGGFYVFTVKANQPTLLEQLRQDYHWEQHAPYSETDCGHGRIETRTIRVSEELNRAVQWLDFPGARVAAQVLREVREKKTGQQRETVVAYLLTNLPPQHARGPELLRLNRGYWGAIENGVHRVRDGALREDQCRARKGHLPRVLAALTNVALSILRMLGTTNIAEAMEELSYSPRAALALALR